MEKTTLLCDIDVLVLDCQATGANPENGYLMEIGWTQTCASHPRDSDNSLVESYLFQLPGELEIPRQVSRVTGLKKENLASGLKSEIIWEKLTTKARQIASSNHMELCPTVIHFSRYEEPYLHHLHQQFTPQKPFPFQIICTHQITRRLLPNLPRKGLRATAGYLGHSVSELRRSTLHTIATVFIWRQEVQLLEEHDVHTLEELQDWFSFPLSLSSGFDRDYPMNPVLRINLPHLPGVYRMLRSNGDLLYIGKASSLKQRVNSYFYKRKQSTHAERTLEMLTQAVHLDVTVTGSALEAALLESDEIKKNSPPYNVALRQRDRKITFFSKDLLHSVPQAHEYYPIGPLPSRESIVPFMALGTLLKKGETDTEDDNNCASILGIPGEYAPDMDCFRSGFEIFRQRHCQILKKLEDSFVKYPVNGLLVLGRKFHLKRLEQQALEKIPNDVEEAVEEQKAPAEWVWTPEAVADTFESLVRRGARLIRRARWFCLLSESSLAWDTGETVGSQRRLLVFRSGNIVQREDLKNVKDVPPPPGYLRPFQVRQQNFDIMTYDRMRVLTTELRRLVSYEKDRNIELRFSPSAALSREALIKALGWI